MQSHEKSLVTQVLGRYKITKGACRVMRSDREIVKVEINLLGKDGPRMLQVSNEDESFHWEGTLVDDVERLLGDRNRAYFYARVINHKLQLGQEAPLQRW